MAYFSFLIRCDNALYVNEELYTAAITKGRRAFVKMLAAGEVSGKKLLGETLYPVTDDQAEVCLEHNPVVQDFDEAFRHFNIVPKETVEQIKEKCCSLFPGVPLVITAAPTAVGKLYRYRQAVFFKAGDYKEAKKYHMMPKLAAVKIFGRLYIALNAVDVRVETPIIITVDDWMRLYV